VGVAASDYDEIPDEVAGQYFPCPDGYGRFIVTTEWRCPTCRLEGWPDALLYSNLRRSDLEATDECTTCAEQRRDRGQPLAKPEPEPEEEDGEGEQDSPEQEVTDG